MTVKQSITQNNSLFSKVMSGKCHVSKVKHETIGSLSNDVYERRMSTGSGPFSSLDDGFAQIFNQIVSIRVKKLSNTNFISSRDIKREKSSLLVDVRRSKTSLLKFPIAGQQSPLLIICGWSWA